MHQRRVMVHGKSDVFCTNSGSQTMAYVMALQQGWPTDGLQFKGSCSIRGVP